MLEIPGYRIETKLYEGTRTVIHRGRRVVDNLPVIIKRLKQGLPSPEEIAQFRREYEVAQEVYFDGIAQTYSLEAFKNTLFMAIEDFGGEPLSKLFTPSQPLEHLEFLRLAIRIVDIIGGIHRRGVIHKDINPSNIVWNRKRDEIKLIDFGISTQLTNEIPTAQSLDALDDTLAYFSPEQTGRMNRSLDYRSDYYSLGVTFYEMLLGSPPFQSKDPMELVHCHLAKEAESPYEANKNIPKPVSDVVMKLLAKMPERRYQSIYGLRYDLQECLEHIKAGNEMHHWQIAVNDVSERFLIPEKLYGREREIERLLKVFERVSAGSAMLMLVAGNAGTGKSALVNELRKPIQAVPQLSERRPPPCAALVTSRAT